MARIDYDKLCYDTVTERMELYDLRTDPGEQDDRSGDDPERLALLWSELQRFMANEGRGNPIPAPEGKIPKSGYEPGNRKEAV